MKINKIFSNSNISFYLFIVVLGVLHFLYFQELKQTITRVPGLKSLLPFMFFSILLVYFLENICSNININKVVFIFLFFLFYIMAYNEIIIEPYDFVTYFSGVSREKSILFQQTADILVVLEWGDPQQQGVAPSKLFDYLVAQVPIISGKL